MLFVLGICNLTFSCYMFTELKNPNVIVVPDPEIKVIKNLSHVVEQLQQLELNRIFPSTTKKGKYAVKS